MRTLSIAMGLALCALSASPSAASVLVVQDGLADLLHVRFDQAKQLDRH